MGITKGAEWATPFLEMRAIYTKVDGRIAPYTLPRLDYNWALVDAGPAP